MLTPEQQAADETTPSDVLHKLASLNSDLARLVAQNPSADGILLQELATSADPVIRQNLAMNPNTPPAVLSELAKQFPRQLFQNPALNLIVLENPNLLTGSTANFLCGFVKRTLAPISVLEFAGNAADERLQLAVTLNPQTPQPILEQLTKSRSPRIAESAQMHVGWSADNDIDWEAIVPAAIDRVLVNSSESFESAIAQVAKIRDLASEIPKDLMRSK